MDLVVFNAEELVAVVRALRAVAQENGVFTDAERDLVEGVAHLHGVTIDASALDPIAPAELARIVTDPHKRKRAVQLAIVTSLVEGAPGSPGEKNGIPERAVFHDVGHMVDLSASEWDFWAVAGVPLEELKQRYNVPPL